MDHIKSELRSQLSKKYKSRGGENELEKYPIEIKEYNKLSIFDKGRIEEIRNEKLVVSSIGNIELDDD